MQCNDNVSYLWIAYAGCQRLIAGQKDGDEIIIHPRWPMDQLQAVENSKESDNG